MTSRKSRKAPPRSGSPGSPAIAPAEIAPTLARNDTIFDQWEITPTELTKTVRENASLRGMLFGYVAELKYEQLWTTHPDVQLIGKSDDHDRKRKGDRNLLYMGYPVTVEVKSLQTNSIKRVGSTWLGKAQVDASDRRTIKMPDGGVLSTTCLLRGEFDLLAVNVFAFEEKWRFVFAKNLDLPCSTFRSYTPEQRACLLPSLIEVSWPPNPPFYEDPYPLIKQIVNERLAKK